MQREDNKDYFKFLSEKGVTEDQVQKIVQGIYTGEKEVFTLVKPSPIHGKGIFCGKTVPAKTSLRARTEDGLRTLEGRYMNHSKTPNCEAILQNDLIYFLTLNDIEAHTELTVNYRQVDDLLKGD